MGLRATTAAAAPEGRNKRHRFHYADAPRLMCQSWSFTRGSRHGLQIFRRSASRSVQFLPILTLCGRATTQTEFPCKLIPTTREVA
jgi:hypothetical protein